MHFNADKSRRLRNGKVQAVKTEIRVLMTLVKQARLLTFLSVNLVFTDIFLDFLLFFIPVFKAAYNAFALYLLFQVRKVDGRDLVSIEVRAQEAAHSLNLLSVFRVHIVQGLFALFNGN